MKKSSGTFIDNLHYYEDKKEITDTCEKIDAFITSLDDHLIVEVVRSGVSAISLGDKAIQS